MRPLIHYLRPLAPKSVATTSDWAGVEQVSSEFSRVSILHDCPPTVTWHEIVRESVNSNSPLWPRGSHQSCSLLSWCGSLLLLLPGNGEKVNIANMIEDYESWCPHRVGIHRSNLRKSVIDKHVSIWVDRCGSGFPFKNRFACTCTMVFMSPNLPRSYHVSQTQRLLHSLGQWMCPRVCKWCFLNLLF